MSFSVSEVLARRFHDILTLCEGDVPVAIEKISLAYKAAGRQVTVAVSTNGNIYIGGGDEDAEECVFMEIEYRDGEWICEMPGTSALAETIMCMTWVDEDSQEWRILGHGVDKWSIPDTEGV